LPATSQWEAPNEIHPGQWQDAIRPSCLRVVREADFKGLPAGNRDAAHLLQSRLLRRSLRQRYPAARKPGKGIMKARRPNRPADEKDIVMSTRISSCNKSGWVESAFASADPTTPQPRATHLSAPSGRRGQHEVTRLLTDIDGVPVLVRFLVGDVSGDVQSHFVSGHVDLYSLLSSTVEKMVDRMGGSPLRRDDPSRQTLATVELISSAEDLARLPVLSNDTVLRVGPLELDLLDRTAKRGDRQIDLRPREFQLLKYMMQRSEKLLTRAALLKDVWNYKFVPNTNLVDVHMGRLRHKVDGPGEPPLIRNVRGVGFVLSATAFPQCPTPQTAGRAGAWPHDNSSRTVETTLLQC
jgi:DNA-binding winged helix-turn-helix (wHTH) protein